MEYTDEEKQEIIERIAAYKRLKTPAQLKELWLELSEKVRYSSSSRCDGCTDLLDDVGGSDA